MAAPTAEATRTSIKVKWNDMGAGVTEYKVYYSEDFAADRREWVVVGTPTGTSQTKSGLTCDTDYHFRVGSKGDGVKYRAVIAYAPAIEGTTSPCPLDVSINVPNYWPDEKESVTLAANIQGGPDPSTYLYTWQEQKGQTWSNIGTLSTKDLVSNSKETRVFQLKVIATANLETATSDPVTVRWVSPIRIEKNPSWRNTGCSPRWSFEWKVYSPATSGPHFSALFIGRPTDAGTDSWVCIKGRFRTHTDGAQSVLVNGTISLFHDTLDTSADALRTDGLTLGTLRGLYSTPAKASDTFESDDLTCNYCKGGFIESDPVRIKIKYLKQVSLKASGSHEVEALPAGTPLANNKGISSGGGTIESTSRASWEQHIRPKPPRCTTDIDLGYVTVILEENVYWVVEELAASFGVGPILCSIEYRNLILEELEADFSSGLPVSIANRVIGEFILPWEDE